MRLHFDLREHRSAAGCEVLADGVSQQYQPLSQAAKPWRVCALLPHGKDRYWWGVAWGLDEEAARQGVRLGIYEAGGIPLEFPIHPIQETGKRPTAGLDRNLAYLGLVEVLYGYPLDGVVLTPPKDNLVLPGITYDVVLEIARALDRL